MAKLKRLPSLNIINGFKGKVDFYVYMGTPCARLWPRSPGHDRAPAVEAQWPTWTWAASSWNILSPVIREAYRQMAADTNMTARDIFTKSFISGESLLGE